MNIDLLILVKYNSILSYSGNNELMDNITSKRRIIKALVAILELLAIGGFLYLIFLPFYPAISYYFKSKSDAAVNYKNIEEVKKEVEGVLSQTALESGGGEEAIKEDNGAGSGSRSVSDLPAKATTSDKNGGDKPLASPADKKILPPNRLIIPKIGVNAPIIESADENYALAHGVWRLPKSSTPEEQGNIIITGHRFKYLPPSNLTFYLFHKLEEGDIASVIWNGGIYYYRISEKKIVSAADTSILRETDEATLTMYTCDPIYSTKNRLVITSKLISKN